MEYWPWWASGLGLAVVAVAHWLLARRMLAVSGRFTAIVDRLRHGGTDEPDMTRDEMLTALRDMTAREFGAEALQGGSVPPAVAAPTPPRPTMVTHLLFLGGLVVGGLVSAAMAGSFEVVSGLRSATFAAVVDGGFAGPLLLLLGGVFVGFGTRMAGGCTSGHGLCGVSRFQPGSLAATAAFFGTGIVVSLLLGALA